MSGHVYFYKLSHKFVDEQFDVPQEAKDILYYSLAIGHHLGVVDCLSADLVCTQDDYMAWMGELEEGSEARRKMEGFATFGEVTIYREHCQMLACAFNRLRQRELTPRQREWTECFMQQLAALHSDPNMYLMVRSR